MATTSTSIQCLLSIIFLTLVIKGSSIGCSLNNITIGTTRSGREINNTPEWNVVVTNNCNCIQSQLTLTCTGFKTLQPVDPSILSVTNGVCLLINGKPLPPFGSVKFSYVWYPPFVMWPKSSTIGSCN
ncbi:uncharacterized protein LOC131618594 [Vicia villosa]|uniref:uncharacterized protein LOC131618594 n=1 Tax=Vicia villosa TaxID=3911 RepID=UPI00273B7DCD|nr:uncharacterized protein LOC131618594 [Vicia villosa]